MPSVVLVVEDEPTVLALAKSILETNGFEALSAANAKEALALLDGGTEIDILFTDIHLPDGTAEALDGLELAQRAVAMRPGLRVIYTSGDLLTDGMTARFVDEGAFFKKPYTNADLVSTLRGEPTTPQQL